MSAIRFRTYSRELLEQVGKEDYIRRCEAAVAVIKEIIARKEAEIAKLKQNMPQIKMTKGIWANVVVSVAIALLFLYLAFKVISLLCPPWLGSILFVLVLILGAVVFYTFSLGAIFAAALGKCNLQASTQNQIDHDEMQKEFAESFKELFEFEIETVRKNEVKKENPNIKKVQRLGVELYMGKTHAQNLDDDSMCRHRENVMRLNCPDDLWNEEMEF